MIKKIQIGVSGSKEYSNNVGMKEYFFKLKELFGNDFEIVTRGKIHGAEKLAKKMCNLFDIEYKEVKPLYKTIKKYLLQQAAPEISKASNSATTVDKFEGRQNYKELVNDWNYPRGLQDNLLYDNRLDIWYKQPFYGRVCNKNNLIYTNYFIYRNIAEKGADPICVFDFVAKAFENMKKIFKKIIL